MKKSLLIASLGAIALIGCDSPTAGTISAELVKASSIESTEAKKGALESFVAKHKSSPDPKVQDAVTRGSIKLAYAESESGDFERAREVFLKASESYKGTGQMDPSFGTLDEQAAYQAIVCLAADGKKEQAISEFTQFIKERPLSPLVFASHKRLISLDKANRELYDSLLDAAKAKQETEGRLAMARCGPLAVAELLKLKSKTVPAIKQLEEDCGMKVTGSTMAGLAKALNQHGLPVEGKELNLSDFRKEKVPFIWLHEDHYLVVTKISDQVTAYDPFLKGPKTILLPRSAADFRAAVLAPVQ